MTPNVSTGEAYGSITDGSWPEDCPPAPNSPYAAGRLGSAGPVLPPHPRPGCGGHPLLQQRVRISFADGPAATVRWYGDNRAWWEPLKKKAALMR
ncbi:hypothetical protein GCM10010390_17710 [Streptomyces mordarskii]|uniref:Uncharacterized protein n=1 Tax=Streptomyces mordarskii TaxID=1226758 RepID=A0ABN1CCQ2_9ACTN